MVYTTHGTINNSTQTILCMMITYLVWARRCSNTDNPLIDFVGVASSVLNIPGDRAAFDPMLRFRLPNLASAADTLD